jgi:hypothetical protein
LNHKLQEQLVENDRLKKEMMKEKPAKIEIHVENDLNARTPVINDMQVNPKQCSGCKRIFQKIYNLKQHLPICKGVDNSTCPTCLRTFNTRQAKSQHIKKGKCVRTPVPTKVCPTSYHPNTNSMNNGIQMIFTT